MPVKVDIVEGETLAETSVGYQHTRTFDVSGYSGSGPQLLHSALNTAGIPVRGDPHPVIPGIQVLSREARQLARNAAQGHIARVTIVYGAPEELDDPLSAVGGGETELASGLLTETTARDVNGNLMTMRFTRAQVIITQVAQAQVERPVTRATIQRVEGRVPTDVALEFTGSVNSVPWSGFPSKTWRCDGVRARTVNRSTSVLVSYDFTYRSATWRFEASVNEDGLLPVDSIIGNGIERFDVYPGVDFNRLGIVLPR